MKILYVEIENEKKILIEKNKKRYILNNLKYQLSDINNLIEKEINPLNLDLSSLEEVS